MDGLQLFAKAIQEYNQKIPSPVDDYKKEMRGINNDLKLLVTSFNNSKKHALNAVPARVNCVMQGWSGSLILIYMSYDINLVVFFEVYLNLRHEITLFELSYELQKNM